MKTELENTLIEKGVEGIKEHIKCIHNAWIAVWILTVVILMCK